MRTLAKVRTEYANTRARVEALAQDLRASTRYAEDPTLLSRVEDAIVTLYNELPGSYRMRVRDTLGKVGR